MTTEAAIFSKEAMAVIQAAIRIARADDIRSDDGVLLCTSDHLELGLAEIRERAKA